MVGCAAKTPTRSASETGRSIGRRYRRYLRTGRDGDRHVLRYLRPGIDGVRPIPKYDGRPRVGRAIVLRALRRQSPCTVSLNREADGVRRVSPGIEWWRTPGPRDHIVQLYQDQDFLNRAVCRFAGAALANGEGLILVPTLTHWNAFRPRLEAEGVDVEAARERGQLTVVDADEFLPRFMRDGHAGFTGIPRPRRRTSSDRRALEGATRKCVGGERWSMSCGSAGMSPPA